MTDNLHPSAEESSDRAREDRVVAYLRRHGVFGGVVTPDAPRPGGRPSLRRWRVPMIAAAAAVVLGVVSVIVDRAQRSGEPPVVTAEAPTLLIWY